MKLIVSPIMQLLLFSYWATVLFKCQLLLPNELCLWGKIRGTVVHNLSISAIWNLARVGISVPVRVSVSVRFRSDIYKLHTHDFKIMQSTLQIAEIDKVCITNGQGLMLLPQGDYQSLL